MRAWSLEWLHIERLTNYVAVVTGPLDGGDMAQFKL